MIAADHTSLTSVDRRTLAYFLTIPIFLGFGGRIPSIALKGLPVRQAD